ncbi:hypothetical protein CPHO_02355 [Corynebacterium phocae]|uniref:Uncharacterized protein n=1 Tax=Corynebacterium phocae TaxID=161895 RepID=A0A1L7D1V3_9CORY|nr:hypothetical protein [Corynebacterium phocae]APT91941.1 hypothetical protein CPHO_02355 [Corynebacterium phocae]KAA8726926.1 hypothetical protein F4V58_01890 [Corynebacterium phocae]
MSLIAAPSAHAQPQLDIRQSAHGQYLCRVTGDEQAARALVAAYGATLEAAARQARELDEQDFNAADLAIITADTPSSQLSEDLLKVLTQPFLESSINRARQYIESIPTGNRAPLLSEGQEFSSAFRAILAANEGQLRTAIAEFEAASGNEALRAAFRDCIKQLQERGVSEGFQPVPQVEVPVVVPTKDNEGSSTGAIVGIVAAILGLLGLGAYLFNSGLLNPGGIALPGLPRGF